MDGTGSNFKGYPDQTLMLNSTKVIKQTSASMLDCINQCYATFYCLGLNWDPVTFPSQPCSLLITNSDLETRLGRNPVLTPVVGAMHYIRLVGAKCVNCWY